MASGMRYLRVPPFSSSGLHVNYDKTLTKLASSFEFCSVLEQSFKMLCSHFWPEIFLFEATVIDLLPLPPKLRILSKTTKVCQIREHKQILQVSTYQTIKTSITMLFKVQKCFMTSYQVHICVKYDFHFRHQCTCLITKNHIKLKEA